MANSQQTYIYMKCYLFSILTAFLCIQLYSFDIRFSKEGGQNSKPELEDPFTDARKWIGRPTFPLNDKAATELKVVVSSTWGSYAIYGITITDKPNRSTKGTFDTYVSYTASSSRLKPASNGVLLQVGPISSDSVKKVISGARSLLDSELKIAREAKPNNENARKESLCLLTITEDGEERKIGINSHGTEDNWKAIDAVCTDVLALMRANLPSGIVPELLSTAR